MTGQNGQHRSDEHFEPYEEERGIPAPFYLGAFGLLLWGVSVFIMDREPVMPLASPNPTTGGQHLPSQPPRALGQPMPALAADPAALAIIAGGKGAAWACSSCHGLAGEGADAVPRLAGLSAAYITKQLNDFAAGTRVNDSMRVVALALSPEERTSLGAAYAAMAAPTVAHARLGGDLKRGEQLATAGDDAKGLAGCFTCHGDQGLGVDPDFPALAGQPAAYLDQQLLFWTSGLRHNSPDTMMNDIAKALSDADRRAVSDYIAGLPPPDPHAIAE